MRDASMTDIPPHLRSSAASLLVAFSVGVMIAFLLDWTGVLGIVLRGDVAQLSRRRIAVVLCIAGGLWTARVWWRLRKRS
jgi:membrane protein CcdC involved in cytochrome C biogenesis